MNPCLDCDITDKLEYCCGTHPVTGKSKLVVLLGHSSVSACPEFGEGAMCGNYAGRPGICREYYCHKYNELDVFDLIIRRR